MDQEPSNSQQPCSRSPEHTEDASTVLKELLNTTFDLVIIGGGVTGACLAHDATLHGLRVALVGKSHNALAEPGA